MVEVQLADEVGNQSRMVRGASDGEVGAGLAEAGLAGACGKWVESKVPLLFDV
jgi:hypothetical protein